MPSPKQTPSQTQREQVSIDALIAWLFARHRHGKARDPKRMNVLIERLALTMPRRVIHVVGTNGKGSVSAMVAKGFEHSGLRVGRFISPHIERFNERISINQRDIEDDWLVHFITQVQTDEHLHDASFFEITLALALAYFQEKKVDIAVMEAGVGAKYDATMCLANVVATIITNVDLDHQETLGKTLTAIAKDKAAAIRPATPVVTGATAEARKIVYEMGRQHFSPILDSGQVSKAPFGLEAAFFKGLDDNQQLAAITLGFLGLPPEHISVGLKARLPGRLERFVIQDRIVILDGAHNPAAANRLVQRFSGYTLVFAALPKKQFKDMLSILTPSARHVILTCIPGYSCPFSSDEMVITSPQEAVNKALSLTTKGDIILVTGSFYLLGVLRPWLRSCLPD